jgi:hypothetical protein
MKTGQLPDFWNLAHGRPAGAARLGERDWNVLVAHDLPTGAMKDLPYLLDTVLEASIEIVQEIPDHVTPVRRGHPPSGSPRSRATTRPVSDPAWSRSW